MSFPIHPAEIFEKTFEGRNPGKKKCPDCGGSGYKFKWFFKKEACKTCYGRGSVRKKSWASR